MCFPTESKRELDFLGVEMELWHSPRLSAYRQLMKDKGFALQALQAAGPKVLAQMPEDFWQERLGSDQGEIAGCLSVGMCESH